MSIRILLADDHQMLRDGLCSILASESDMEVVGETGDGRTAVSMCRTLVPDVVVMDIAMPDLNGVEATRQIKRENPKVKVVALSMYPDRRYVIGMLEAGASGYVLKASAYDELTRAVRVVSEGKKYLSPDITGVVVEAHVHSTTASDTSPYKVLGPREREIVQLLAEGKSSPQIAQQLHISTGTVDTHRRNIMKKLGIHTVVELTKYAIREGLTSIDH
jgi:DNA-binding NarL/FixJ family response regulator